MRRPTESVRPGGSGPFLALVVAVVVRLTPVPGAAAAHPVPTDFRNLFRAESALPLAAGTASTILLFLLETEEERQGAGGGRAREDFEDRILARVSSPVVLTAVSLGGYALGALSGSESTTGFFSPYARGLVTTNLLAGGLKLATGRTRPDGSDRFSFPSAHTASACFAASFLWDKEGWRVGLPAALLAALVGLSRVDTGAHYPSDVLAGATLGVVVGAAVARTESGREDGEDGSGGGFFLRWSSSFGLGVSAGGGFP